MTSFAPIKKPGLVAMIALGVATSSFGQQVKNQGAVVRLDAPAQSMQANTLDFANAKPMPVPTPSVRPPSLSDSLLQASSVNMGAPGSSTGSAGSGQQAAVRLAPASSAKPGSQDLFQPEEFGTSQQPYNTARANAYGDNTQYYYPYRPTGKLFLNVPGGTASCSASLIKPGVVVTAAHCVANFGKKQFYSNWVFAPAYNNGVAPYGAWNVASAIVLTSYYNGTDSCAVSGVVCSDDVAVLILAPQNGTYAGSRTGWYTYGWNGWGFNSAKQTLITQLGYPGLLDYALDMIRNDSQGYVSASYSNNTIIGSGMTAGSSGGPWIVNFGMSPIMSVAPGQYAVRNAVMGVTSWGYTDPTVKQQGASSFTSANIVPLVNTACTAVPGAC
jgi:hypothetical protein